MEGQRVEIPEKLKFNHHFKKLRRPFVLYADFSSFTQEIEEPEDENIKTYNSQEHKPCGFMLHLVNAVDNTNHEYLHRGADAVSVIFCT